MVVFWVVAPCSLVEVYQRFRGPCCLHHQGDSPEYTVLQPRRQPSSYFEVRFEVQSLRWSLHLSIRFLCIPIPRAHVYAIKIPSFALCLLLHFVVGLLNVIPSNHLRNHMSAISVILLSFFLNVFYFQIMNIIFYIYIISGSADIVVAYTHIDRQAGRIKNENK
jgi:hypothetical protein